MISWQRPGLNVPLPVPVPVLCQYQFLPLSWWFPPDQCILHCINVAKCVPAARFHFSPFADYIVKTFYFQVGLPAKSGVSGAILIVVPKVCGMMVWSPPLDHHGNSVRGMQFCKVFVQLRGYSVSKAPNITTNPPQNSDLLDLFWETMETAGTSFILSMVLKILKYILSLCFDLILTPKVMSPPDSCNSPPPLCPRAPKSSARERLPNPKVMRAIPILELHETP